MQACLRRTSWLTSGDEVDHDELTDTIVRYFHAAEQAPDGAVICPGRGVVALRIVADGDRVAAIYRGPDLDPGDLERLRAVIRAELIESTGSEAREHVLFTSRPVNGSWRHPSGLVAIRAAPPNAPRADVLMGDHPFLLTTVSVQSLSWMVSGERARRRVREWTWILNAILVDRIRTPGMSAAHNWTLVDIEGDGPIEDRVRWLQQFYAYEPNPGLSHEDQTPIARVPDAEYYGFLHAGLVDDFDLPASIDLLVDSVPQSGTRAAGAVPAGSAVASGRRRRWRVPPRIAGLGPERGR